MRFKSFSKSLEGVVKEVLGTAFSVGCQVDGKSPKAIQDAIAAGEIDSECTRTTLSGRRQMDVLIVESMLHTLGQMMLTFFYSS